MFFQDIQTWEQSKLKKYFIGLNIAYFVLCLLIPIIIIGTRYQIFTSDKVRLTGWGWILAITLVVVGLRLINKLINKLPDNTINQQRVKFSLLGVKALIIPICALVFLRLLKNDFDLAYSTMWWCLFSFTFGIILDYTCLMYVDKEFEIRKKAQEQNEIDKRKELLK